MCPFHTLPPAYPHHSLTHMRLYTFFSLKGHRHRSFRDTCEMNCLRKSQHLAVIVVPLGARVCVCVYVLVFRLADHIIPPGPALYFDL